MSFVVPTGEPSQLQTLTVACVCDGITDNATAIQAALGGPFPVTGQQVTLLGRGVAVVNSPVIIGASQSLTAFGASGQGSAQNLGGFPPGLAIVAGPNFNPAIPAWAQTLYGLPAAVSSPLIEAGSFAQAIGFASAGLAIAQYSCYVSGNGSMNFNMLAWRSTVTAFFGTSTAGQGNLSYGTVGNTNGGGAQAIDIESSDWVIGGMRLTHGQKTFGGAHTVHSNGHYTSGNTTGDTGYNIVCNASQQFDNIMIDSTPSGATAVIQDNVTVGYLEFYDCIVYQNSSSITTIPVFHKTGTHGKIVEGLTLEVNNGSTFAGLDDFTPATVWPDIFRGTVASATITGGISGLASLFPNMGSIPPVIAEVMNQTTGLLIGAELGLRFSGSAVPTMTAPAGAFYFRSGGQAAGARLYYNTAAGNNWVAATGV